MPGNITYLSSHQLDKLKWDQCIEQAANGVIYGYSFYLDAMCDNWDALVLNDYEAVMPLPWRKKFSVYYIYQPFLVAQLGLFGKQITAGLLSIFLDNIPKKYRYWDFPLNHGNIFSLANHPLFERANYVLSLRPSYNDLHDAYRQNIKRNIKKAIQYGCEIKKDIAVASVIQIAKEQNHLREENFIRFEKLFYYLHQQKKAIAYGIFSGEQLVASAAFLFSHNRAYYILVGNHPNGRTLGASHLLIDAFIEDHAGQQLLLDFEGSDIRNLSFFYSSFGAVEEKYTAIKLNRLPWFARWLKR
jgi:hypothetical protein